MAKKISTPGSKKYAILYSLVVVTIINIFYSCSFTSSDVPEKRDTAITVVNSYSSIFFDSLQLENFFTEKEVPDTLRRLMLDFYNVRNFQYAWFDKNGISEQAVSARNLQQNYINTHGDRSLDNPVLDKLWDSVEIVGRSIIFPEDLRNSLEFEQTYQFYKYAFKAYVGNNVPDPRELKWFIPRRKVSLTSLLDSIVVNKGENITSYEPVNRQYQLLSTVLKKYSDVKEKGGWGKITFNKKKYEPGDSLPEIAWIRNRLYLSADLPANDSSMVYDDALLEAVKKFQLRHGLAADGVIGVGTLSFMENSVEDVIRKILVNMERLRWVPADPETDYLLVNIPEYRLHLYENGQHVYQMNVVVGSTQHNTVIFNDELKYVVFSPYWNVPPGILKDEVLPGIAKDSNYLVKHNMERFSGGVRQKPGPSNSLGLVKFLFPNSYNIYLHDTPSKSLFNESSRAFSHGCIRVAEPLKLAEWILRKDTAWTTDKMVEAMHTGKEKYVEVADKVPVIIGYFTTWVDSNGEFQVRKDIYGHDATLMSKIFTKTNGG